MNEQAERNHNLGIIYGILSAISFTCYLIPNRYVYTHYGVEAFNYTATFLIVSGCCALISFVFDTARSDMQFRQRQLPFMILNGFVGTAAMGLLIFGQRYTSAVNASIIAAATSIPTILFSRLLLKERLSHRQLAWLAIMFVGLYFAIVGRHLLNIEKGDVIILGSLVFFGFSNTFSKILMKHNSSGLVTDIRLITGGVMFAVLGLLFAGSDFLVTTAGLWPVLAGFSFWLTIKLFYASIHHIGPNRAVILCNSHPVITPFAGVLLLGEPYSWVKACGSAIMLLSIYNITKKDYGSSNSI